MALAVLALLGARYWRLAADTTRRMWAAAWAGLSAAVWAGADTAREAFWWACFTAVLRCAQLAVRALLWLVLWVPLTTGIGTLTALGDSWPLAATLVILVILSAVVVKAVWHGRMPPARHERQPDVADGRLEVRYRMCMSLLSWRFLVAAQKCGAFVLAVWLKCEQWKGLVAAVCWGLHIRPSGGGNTEAEALTAGGGC